MYILISIPVQSSYRRSQPAGSKNQLYLLRKEKNTYHSVTIVALHRYRQTKSNTLIQPFFLMRVKK